EKAARRSKFLRRHYRERRRRQFGYQRIAFLNQLEPLGMVGGDGRRLLIVISQSLPNIRQKHHQPLPVRHLASWHERRSLERDLSVFGAEVLQHVRAVENPGQPIIIFRRDRIELVIVTASAAKS